MNHHDHPVLTPAALHSYESLPICCLVLSPALKVITASDDYLQLIGKERSAIIDQEFFEFFSQRTPEQEALLRSSLNQALLAKQKHMIPLLRYDGKVTAQHWQVTHKPILDAAGNVSYLIQVLTADPTPETATRRAERLKQEMDMLFEAVPAQIAIVSGPELTYSYINPRYKQELFPHREVMGLPLLAALPEVADEPVLHILNQVYQTGETFAENEMHVALAGETGGTLQDHYFNVVYQPLRDTDGRVNAILSFKYEVTELVVARKLVESRETELQAGYLQLTEAIVKHQATAEELATTNDELKQAQYDLLRFNDQLEERIRQRTRELEKSKAQQQALNEEMTVINEELSSANKELVNSKNDLERTIDDLAVSEQKVRSIVESAPFPIGVYTGLEMRVELVNQSIIDVWGKGPDLIGKTYREVLPELEGFGIYEQLEQVYLTGIPFHAVEQRVDLVMDGILQHFYFNYDFTPLFDRGGRVYGVMNTAADVTGLVNAKIQIENSQKNLFNVIMQSPVAKCILVGPEHRVEVANNRIIELWGKRREAVIGKPLFEGLPDARGQGLEELLAGVYERSETFEARERLVELERNGVSDKMYIDFVYQPYRDTAGRTTGVMVTAVDVTAQVDARTAVQRLNEELAATNEELIAANEEQSRFNHELKVLNDALQISQDELQLAIDAAGLGTWDLNPWTGRFTGNLLTKSWFGLQPAGEIEFSKATHAIVEDDRLRVIAAIERAMHYSSGGAYDIDYTIVNPVDETRKVVRAKGQALFNDRQEAVRFSGILLDITEQKKDEQRKNDFIGIVSHELKTPLTSLKALLQVSAQKLRGSNDQFLSGAMDKSNTQVQKMETMINGFLNISRLESGKLEINKTVFDLNDLIAEVIIEMQLTATGHRLIFRPEVPLLIRADEEKINSVVSNLVSNAIKYSSRGTAVTIRADWTGGEVMVSIRDQGIGISPADQERLFERYYRVESSRTRHISGFGIGLYLCSEIISRHNGRIWVESKEGDGATFCFRLPANLE